MCKNHILCVQKTLSILLHKETLSLRDNFNQVAPIRYSKKTFNCLIRNKSYFVSCMIIFNLQSCNSAEIIQSKYKC